MTREEAIKFVKAYIRQKYRRQKVMAIERGVTEDCLSKAVRKLSPWLLKECGLTKQVEVTYKAGGE